MAHWEDEAPVEPKSWLLRNPRLLVYTIAGLIALVFVADVLLPTHSAIGTVYAVPILFTLWLGRRRVTVWTAVLCALLDAVTIVLHDIHDEDLGEVLIGRLATIFSISIATTLGLMRLRAERELRYVRQWAVTTLRSLGEAVISIGVDGRVHFVNEVAERMLGRPRGQVLGRLASDVFLVRDSDPQRPPVVELQERGIVDVREALLFAFGGRRIPIEYSRTSIASPTGEPYGEVVVFRDIRARKEHEDAIKRLAYRDELTGLPNRTSLLDRFQLELAHARRNRELLGVVYLDLDGFKRVNDTHGHEAGDEVLKHAARRLSSTLRAGDTVARLGGDEFVLLLPAVAGAEEARRVGAKLIGALEQPVPWQGGELRISASVGVALFPRDGEEPDTLMRRADKAMYRAKSIGAGHVEPVSQRDADQ